jgi:hypothetical protein
MGEIKQIQVVFSNLKLNTEIKHTTTKFVCQGREYEFNEVVELDRFGKDGLRLDLLVGEEAVGTVYLSALLLTLRHIEGELPVYSSTEECLGTVRIDSPSKSSPPPH